MKRTAPGLVLVVASVTPLLSSRPAAPGASTPALQDVVVRVLPERPLIERSRCCQLLNFDFELRTSGPDTLAIERVDVYVRDIGGGLLSRRHVSTNGMLPSVATLSATRVAPERVATVYNPFFTFDRETPLVDLRYVFTLRGSGGRRTAEANVRPVGYETRTDLILPLRGRITVTDGHDYYSHHRRLDLAALAPLGLAKRQFNRYAYDFMIVDEAGRYARTDGRRNEDWLGYGALVFAPGDGIVKDAVNDAPEHLLPDSRWDDEASLRNPRSIPGNFVVIDHRNGEFSFIAHLKQGSLRVKVGDAVRRGQVIGVMGLSGDSYAEPHVHYQLMDNGDFQDAEGLPSYFSGFTRVGGRGGVERRGQIDTGDVIIAR